MGGNILYPSGRTPWAIMVLIWSSLWFFSPSSWLVRLDETEVPHGPWKTKPPWPGALSSIGPCGPIGVWHSMQCAIGPARQAPYSAVGLRSGAETVSTGGP